MISCLNCYAQNLNLQIRGTTDKETQTIKDLSYRKNHKSSITIQEEIESTQFRLTKEGYLETIIVAISKVNDSSQIAILKLGSKTTTIIINIKSSPEIKRIILSQKDSITIPYLKVETFLNEQKRKLEAAGYTFSVLKLNNIRTQKQYLFADLDISTTKQKAIDKILVIENNTTQSEFPKGHLKQINREFKNNILSEHTLKKINDEFAKYNFVRQTKYPETLFTTDSTKVYVYLDKQNGNSFDGFIGFNDNESKKIILSGYLDLQLQNILDSGEEFKLNWKSDGENQRIFNTSLELPYLFKSPIGVKGQINIFKQDSTFQNTKTGIELSYFLKYNKRFYLGYESTTSSDIQNTNNKTLSDYLSNFITARFTYNKRDNNNIINPNKANTSLKVGLGKRNNTSDLQTENQINQNYIELTSDYTFYLSQKHHLHLKGIFHSLHSNSYNINELYRFGGINSIRGFQENSLTAKNYLIVATEYRYLLNNNFYLNTILDYSNYIAPNASTSMFYKYETASAGLGFSLQKDKGILRFSAVKNYNNDDKTDFSNMFIHCSYNIKF
jgi:hypothetical protein